MAAARFLAAYARKLGPFAILVGLFTAGIATATAGGAGDSLHARYWTVRAANPQLAWRRFAEETPVGTCADDQTTLIHGAIDIHDGSAVASFSIAAGCLHVPVQLASFSTPAAGFSLPQHLVDSASGVFDEGGPYHLVVHLPSCETADDDHGFQVDLLRATHIPDLVTHENVFSVAAAVNGGIDGCPSSTTEHPPATSTGEHSPTDTHGTTTETHPTTTETHPTTTHPTTAETHPTTTETHPTTTETHPTTTETHPTTTETHPTTTTPTTPTTPTTATLPTIDLVVAKSASVSSATVGDEITYTITVRNSGPATATGVVLVDDVPSQETLVSVTPSQGSCSGTGPIRCSLGTIASGRSATVTIVVRAARQGTAVNTAAASGSEPETNSANNSAQATVTIGAFTPPVCPRLTVTHAPQTAAVGRRVAIVAHVRDQQGNGVGGVVVHLRGGGVDRTKTTDASGNARFEITPRRTGVIQVSIAPSASCSGNTRGLVQVRGAFRPPRPKVTG